VDDDRLFIEVLVAFLASDGRFDVVGTANNGREGGELASALRPDVVLMDIDMPIMDGVEASRRIRHQLPDLPIVLVSASQFVDRVAQARDAGATGYVQKGRVDTDLVETILAAVEGRREAAADLLRASLSARPA
jgi:DNA-binding NarL/FixJ family response regulator